MLAHLQTRVIYHAIGYRLSLLSHFYCVEATLMSD
jgi:hypothetical protein